MTTKELDERLEESESLKAITQAYSEIANLKVKRIRANVERNRIYFQEISQVFAYVKKFASNKKIALVKPKPTVALVLTSNHGFYGSINTELLKFFVSQTKNLNTDRIVVNKAGIDFFRSQPIFSGYQEVLLKNDEPDTQELISIVNMIKDYSRVLVFYSTMKSLLKQEPTVTDITASSEAHLGGTYNPGLNDAASKGNKPGLDEAQDFKFIFEPELPKILAFFDSQINTLLLEEAFLESELSRTASRFIAMDEAENASNKSIKHYQTLIAYAKRNADNNTILENFATMIAVKKGEL